jgi:hypothetical protein
MHQETDVHGDTRKGKHTEKNRKMLSGRYKDADILGYTRKRRQYGTHWRYKDWLIQREVDKNSIMLDRLGDANRRRLLGDTRDTRRSQNTGTRYIKCGGSVVKATSGCKRNSHDGFESGFPHSLLNGTRK